MVTNILMLDLEGVLIATAIPLSKYREQADFGMRPHAKYFLRQCQQRFDNVYLNTCVHKERAREVMRLAFHQVGFPYYEWRNKGEYGKANGYELFKDSRIVHVEDESISGKEAQRIIELGHKFISVQGWYPHHAWGPNKEKNKQNDNELLNVLPAVLKAIESFK